MELLHKINFKLIITILLILIDTIICSGLKIIEFFFSNDDDNNNEDEKNKEIINLGIEIGLIILIAFFIILFMVLRKKCYCIIGGFTYLIFGILFWLYKSITSFLEILKLNDDEYSNYLWVFILGINLLLIALRIPCYFIIKKIYNILEYIEIYYFEREHTEFIKKLGDDLTINIIKEEECNSEDKNNNNEN